MARLHPLLVVRGLCIIGLVCLFVATYTAYAHNKLNPFHLYEYNGLDHEQRLTNGACKHGTMSCCHSLNLKNSQLITEVLETDGAEMGRTVCDILRAGLVSASMQKIPATISPSPWQYVVARIHFFAIAHNANMVNSGEMHTIYQDLLHPHTLIAELLSAGELPLAATVYNQNVERLVQKGAPVKRKPLTPTFGRPNAISVGKHAPHPHAALLFADFMLSRGVQALLKEHHRVPSSHAVGSPLNQFPYQMIDPVIVLDESAKWEKLWEELFLKDQEFTNGTG